MTERLVKAAESKCFVEKGKRKLEDTTAGAELKERFEARQKKSKVEFEEWEKSARPLLDGGEGKTSVGNGRSVAKGNQRRKKGRRRRHPSRDERRAKQLERRDGDGLDVVREHVNRRPIGEHQHQKQQQQHAHVNGRGATGIGAGCHVNGPDERRQQLQRGHVNGQRGGHVNGPREGGVIGEEHDVVVGNQLTAQQQEESRQVNNDKVLTSKSHATPALAR